MQKQKPVVEVDQVWRAYVRDIPQHSRGPSPLELKSMETMVKATPRALKDHLHEKVTLKSVSQARAVCLGYLIERGIFSQATLDIGLGLLGGMTEDIATETGYFFSNAIKDLENVADGVPDFLSVLGKSEEEYMTSNKIGLNKENLAAYRRGTLTIADLLLTQPRVILRSKL